MIDPVTTLRECDTLMLDMDGTLLDLAFDNYVWLELVPTEYARRNRMSESDARTLLYSKMRAMRGQLQWYCLDFWSDYLGMDVIGLHRGVNERIGYLPGAHRFLETVAARDIRLLLVTNSHRDTLDLKTQATGVAGFFDAVYTCHNLGVTKEEQGYWHAVMEAEDFDPRRTMLVDDNLTVLESARTFGMEKLLAISRPATDKPARDVDGFASVEGVSELIVSRD